MLIHTVLAYNNFKYGNIEPKDTAQGGIGKVMGGLSAAATAWNYIQSNSILAGAVGVIGTVPAAVVTIMSAISLISDLYLGY